MPEVPIIWLLVAGVGGIFLGISVEQARIRNMRTTRRARRAFKRARQGKSTNPNEVFIVWSSADNWETAREEGHGDRNQVLILFAELDDDQAFTRDLKIRSEGEVPTRESEDVLGRIKS